MLLQRRCLASGCTNSAPRTGSAWHAHCPSTCSAGRGQQSTSTLNACEAFSSVPGSQRHRRLHRTVPAATKQPTGTPSSNKHPAGPGQALLRGLAAALASAVLITTPLGPSPLVEPAAAADAAKVGGCLLRKCQLQLAQCLGDVKCFENIVCLNLCNSAEDETACQIR
jgi:hypothetical protein